MSDTILDALAGEKLLHSNALATVTLNYLVVREGVPGVQTVIAIERVTGIRKLTTTNPGLLVISGGLFTISAASYASKQGLQISLPIALLAALFVLGYLGTRRAAVLFLTENERIESAKGSFREATAVIRAVCRVRGTDLEVTAGRDGGFG
jgi:hypothetical protein